MEAEDVLVMAFSKIFERIDQYKGLGDLRQAKDELFALNFKKDKQNTHK